MKTHFSIEKLDSAYPDAVVLCIGNFDGVHLGHQKILAVAKKKADTLGIPLAVLTFNPHPTQELRPMEPLKLLMTYAEKRDWLARYGVDVCIEEPFNAAFAQIHAHDFFHNLLVGKLKARVVVVGDNFNFGYKREGNVELLEKFGAAEGVEVIDVDPYTEAGEVVSSSRIRACLAQGNIAKANALLSRPFFYAGEVVHGDHRGRTLGFPTANMVCEEKFPLNTGVYVTTARWRGRILPSVTNIGKRPTFTDTQPVIPIRIETHCLDVDLDLYGAILEVCFFSRLRSERKFDSVDALKKQIQTDCDEARAFHRQTHKNL